MTFEERPGVWRTKISVRKIEANLGGTASGAEPANSEMAQECESQFDALLSMGLDYISEHIGKSSAVSGQPHIEWIDIGLSNYGEHQELELYFSDAATYFLWSVRFQYHRESDWKPSSYLWDLADVVSNRRIAKHGCSFTDQFGILSGLEVE